MVWYVLAVKENKEMWGKSLPVQFPGRAADTIKGAVIYTHRCSRCHGAEGQGRFNADSVVYLYPPLWGDHAYQAGPACTG